MAEVKDRSVASPTTKSDIINQQANGIPLSVKAETEKIVGTTPVEDFKVEHRDQPEKKTENGYVQNLRAYTEQLAEAKSTVEALKSSLDTNLNLIGENATKYIGKGIASTIANATTLLAEKAVLAVPDVINAMITRAGAHLVGRGMLGVCKKTVSNAYAVKMLAASYEAISSYDGKYDTGQVSLNLTQSLLNRRDLDFTFSTRKYQANLNSMALFSRNAVVDTWYYDHNPAVLAWTHIITTFRQLFTVVGEKVKGPPRYVLPAYVEPFRALFAGTNPGPFIAQARGNVDQFDLQNIVRTLKSTNNWTPEYRISYSVILLKLWLMQLQQVAIPGDDLSWMSPDLHIIHQPANSIVAGVWYPWNTNPPIVVQPVHKACATDMTTFLKMLDGTSPPPEPAYAVQNWGKTCAIVPLYSGHMSESDVNCAWTLSHLGYPYMTLQGTTAIVNSDGVDTTKTATFIPRANLVAIAGVSTAAYVGRSAGDILFVVVDTVQQNNPGNPQIAIGATNIVVWNGELAPVAGVDIGPALTTAFASNTWLPSISSSIERWSKMYGSLTDAREATTLLGSLITCIPRCQVRRNTVYNDEDITPVKIATGGGSLPISSSVASSVYTNVAGGGDAYRTNYASLYAPASTGAGSVNQPNVAGSCLPNAFFQLPFGWSSATSSWPAIVLVPEPSHALGPVVATRLILPIEEVTSLSKSITETAMLAARVGARVAETTQTLVAMRRLSIGEMFPQRNFYADTATYAMSQVNMSQIQTFLSHVLSTFSGADFELSYHTNRAGNNASIGPYGYGSLTSTVNNQAVSYFTRSALNCCLLPMQYMRARWGMANGDQNALSLPKGWAKEKQQWMMENAIGGSTQNSDVLVTEDKRDWIMEASSFSDYAMGNNGAISIDSTIRFLRPGMLSRDLPLVYKNLDWMRCLYVDALNSGGRPHRPVCQNVSMLGWFCETMYLLNAVNLQYDEVIHYGMDSTLWSTYTADSVLFGDRTIVVDQNTPESGGMTENLRMRPKPIQDREW